MPIAISGSGTISGVSVGGLPDGIVDTDMLAAAAVTAPKRGAGGILQVKQAVKTDTFSYNSGPYVVITGLSVNITPASTSNKILLSCAVYCTSSNNVGKSGVLRFSRVIGGTDDQLFGYIGDADGSRQRAFAQIWGDGDNGGKGMPPCHAQYLDSPSTTSEITYRVMLRCTSGTDVEINKNVSNDANNSGPARMASSITVMEVAA